MRMRFTLPLTVCSLALGTLMTLTGCATEPRMVENLPPPNFNGPSVAKQAPKPAPSAPQPAAAPAKKNNARTPQASSAGIPREWLVNGGTRPWKWIIIHHSATPGGSARLFDKMHRDKGWDELGYHFVIGNGSDTGDGHVEVGTRWPKQKWGAHAKTADNKFNDFGIGICLVGNFDVERPTPQQTRALTRLVAHLMKTHNIPADRVLGHMDTGKPTECPGRNMNIATIRRAANHLANTGQDPGNSQIAGSFLIDGADEGADPSLLPEEAMEPRVFTDP